MHMLLSIVSKCHCVLVTFVFPELCSETEPLVLQFIYVFHDLDMQYLFWGVDIDLYHFYVLLLTQLLMLRHDWYFVFIS